MKVYHVVFLAVAIVTCHACSSDDVKFADREYASIDTGDVTNITENGATLHGEFLGLGDLEIKDYGFIYSQAHSDPRVGTAERVSLGTVVQTEFSGAADHGLLGGEMCWYRAYAIVGSKNLLVYGSERTFNSLGSLPPVITEIVPSSGKQGDTIVINGTGFSDINYNTTVTFAGVTAFVNKTSGTSVTCTVPFLPPGNFDVVIKIGSTGLQSAPKTFTITL